MSDKPNNRKARPRLELHFSDQPGDVPGHVLEELLLTCSETEKWKPYREAMAKAASICRNALEVWSIQQLERRELAEERANAEALALDNAATLSKMDDATKLASVDDEDALLARLREVAPGLVMVDRDTARAMSERLDAEVEVAA